MRLPRILACTFAGLLLVIAAIVLIAPSMTVRLLAERAAAWSGVGVSGLETLEVSLTDARISGGPLSFGQGAGEPARIGRFQANLDGSRLLSGRLVFEDLSLADADLKLSVDAEGRPILNGIPLASSAGQEKPTPEEETAGGTGSTIPAIAIRHATIERARIEYSRSPGQALPLTIDRLSLDDLSPETPDLPARFELIGSAGDARFDYKGEAKVFGQPVDVVLDGGFDNLSIADIEALTGSLGLSRREGRLASSGSHHVTLSGPGNAHVTSTGSVTATGFDLAVPGSIAIRLAQGTFALDAQATSTPDGGVEVSNKAPFDVKGLNVAWSEKGAVDVAAAKLDLDVNALLSPERTVGATLAGSVPLSGLVVAWSETGDVHLDDGTARVDLKLESGPDGAMTIAGPMALAGKSGGIRSGESFRLSYQGIDADFPDARIVLASDGAATVDGKPRATMTGFALDAPGGIQAVSAVIASTSLHVLSPAQGVLVEYAGTLDLNDATKPLDEATRLRLEAMGFDLAGFRYSEEPDLAARLRADIGARARGVRKEGKSKVPFPVRDATLTLAGLDLRLTPTGGVQRLVLDPKTKVVLEGVARGQPHHLSVDLDHVDISDLDPDAPDQLTRADVVAIVNERGRIELDEEVKPFARPPEFVFKGSISDLELPDLSPYAAAAAGLDIESGRFAATGQATGANGKLDGLLKINIQTLDLVPSTEGGDPAADLTGVPVNFAVALLEDSGRRIDVSLPFSGDLSDPEVNDCGVIRTALLGAVRLLVTAPLQGGGKKGGPAGFGPVSFDAGSAVINAEAMQQLGRMAGLLADKPRLRLQVCGRATAADARALGGATPGGAAPPSDEAVSAKMIALAQERGRAALERLGAFAGVKSDQVQQCRPTANPKDAGPPRVEARF
ncbi:MAG: DUF748 domain-containing protein [Rhodospirillales bacterium]|nr:DUF748 domain-containing protein [Rhodospirillales bacterium]